MSWKREWYNCLVVCLLAVQIEQNRLIDINWSIKIATAAAAAAAAAATASSTSVTVATVAVAAKEEEKLPWLVEIKKYVLF